MEDKISVEEFIRENKEVLKLTAIERKLGIPPRTLNKVLALGKDVPKNCRTDLIIYLKTLGENISLK